MKILFKKGNEFAIASHDVKIIQKAQKLGQKLIITTDHGTINCKHPTKVIGNKNISSNLRYKTGRSLSFEEKDVVLLHGITSSGKTEVYTKLIQKVLDKGEQVLFLLPEIALTTQIISRLQNYFGNQISVFHSKYSMNERVEVWNNVLENKPKAQIILGARSSIFLPFNNLGLIVVDEEHETSYKQFEPSPRYNARDSAIVLANIHKGKILLGSATPSLESYFNAQQNKYGFVQLNRRHGNVKLPKIELIDVKEKQRKKEMTGHFSDRLLKLMKKGVTVDQVARVTKAFSDAGILVHAYLMYGFPTQTETETVESLEYVRQLMMHKCIHSAYWHRFAATIHSPVGQHPEQYSVVLHPPENATFANNDIEFSDAVDADHEMLGRGLKKALYNYMHGLGFEQPVSFWFEKAFSEPEVHAQFIEKALQQTEKTRRIVPINLAV